MKQRDKKMLDEFTNIMREGDDIVMNLGLAMMKTAEKQGNQYKDILRQEIVEYKKVIVALVKIIEYYECEYVPAGKLRRLNCDLDYWMGRAHYDIKEGRKIE